MINVDCQPNRTSNHLKDNFLSISRRKFLEKLNWRVRFTSNVAIPTPWPEILALIKRTRPPWHQHPSVFLWFLMNMSCGQLTHALTPAPSWWPSPLPPVSQNAPSFLEVTSARCLCHRGRKSRWPQPPFRITLIGEAQIVGSQRGPTAKLREIIGKRLFWFQNYSQRRSIISFHITITNASQEELTGWQLLWVCDVSPSQWRRH